MKKSYVLILLIGIILVAGCVVYQPPEPPTQPPELPTTLTIPFGIAVYDSDNVDFFNRYAKDYDHISVRPQIVELLDDVKLGKKSLVFGHREDPKEMIALAKEKGVDFLGYNLEEPLSKEELVAKEEEVYELAKANGLLFIFGPTVVNLEKYYADFAQHADIIVLQSQRYQGRDDYEEVVEGLIEKIKSANPEVEVWVQVSVNPPGNREIIADRVIKNIEAIKDKADSISIFFYGEMPDRVLVMEEVFKKFRE